MRNRRVLTILSGIYLMSAVGCATQQLDPRVARSMVELRNDLSSTRAQLDRTMSTLSDIAKNPRLNTGQQVGFFVSEMDKLEESIQVVRDVATQMEADTEKYFTAWSAEMSKMQDQQLANAARDRNEASRRAVADVKGKLENLKEEAAPLMSALRDLQRYFKADTTADAAHSAVPTIEKAIAKKPAVNAKLDEAIAQIDSVTKTVE